MLAAALQVPPERMRLLRSWSGAGRVVADACCLLARPLTPLQLWRCNQVRGVHERLVSGRGRVFLWHERVSKCGAWAFGACIFPCWHPPGHGHSPPPTPPPPPSHSRREANGTCVACPGYEANNVSECDASGKATSCFWGFFLKVSG